VSTGPTGNGTGTQPTPQVTIPKVPGKVGGFLSKIFGSAVSQAAGTAAGAATAGVLIPVLQEEVNTVWSAFPNRPLSAEQAGAAVERGEMTYKEAEAEASLTGFNSSRFEVIERLSGLAPSPDQLLTMFRRGVINADRLKKGLIQGNVRSEWSDALIGISKAIPSVSDMVRFAVREAYGGGSALSGTGAELPGALVTDLKKHGLEANDAEHYWAAHWHLPSPTQGYQMLHRGLMSMGELLELLRVSDYPPYWRGKLADIAYHTPGRIDLRRMLEHGVIDEARVLKGYKDLGYNDENAAILTRFAVELAKPKPESAAVKVDWVARARSSAFGDIHASQKKGNITTGEAASLLGAIGIPEEAASTAASMWETANYVPTRPHGWKPPPATPPSGFQFG